MYTKKLSIGIIIFFTSILSFLPQGCKKEKSPTVVKATVVDLYTQKPLSGVSISALKWHPEENTYELLSYLYTDSNGYFEFGSEDNPSFELREMRKAGYLIKDNTIYDSFVNYETGKVNEGIIPLIPLDSWLSLTVNKTSPGKSKIYLSVYSHILNSEIGASQGRVPLMKEELELTEGQTYSQFPLVASNEILTVHWDFKPLTPWSPFSTPYKDSVFVTRGDTSTIIINY